MKWFVNLYLSKKILLISFVMLMSAISWGAFNSYMGYTVMVTGVKERNKFLTESAHSIIEGLRKKSVEGLMTEADAKKIGDGNTQNIPLRKWGAILLDQRNRWSGCDAPDIEQFGKRRYFQDQCESV